MINRDELRARAEAVRVARVARDSATQEAAWRDAHEAFGEVYRELLGDTPLEDHILALLKELSHPWQPIETAPMGVWVLVYGTMFNANYEAAYVARLDQWGWGDRGGNSIVATRWMLIPEVL
jgi:argininosuccinate lyase